MLIQGQVGAVVGLDGSTPNARQGRTGELIISQAHAQYYETASRGNMFTLTLAATTTGIAAGNLVGAAAAAVTQFALWNPVGSGVNLCITKAYIGLISGTYGLGGPIFHGVITTSLPTIANVGAAYNNLAAGRPPIARYVASAAGTALTGGSAPVTFRAMSMAYSASAYVAAAGTNALELVDGDIVLPPGTGWVPLFPAAGTSVLNAYSVTWEEIPV
jgi:hypothetical protein